MHPRIHISKFFYFSIFVDFAEYTSSMSIEKSYFLLVFFFSIFLNELYSKHITLSTKKGVIVASYRRMFLHVEDT